MTANGREWPRMAANGRKWPQMDLGRVSAGLLVVLNAGCVPACWLENLEVSIDTSNTSRLWFHAFASPLQPPYNSPPAMSHSDGSSSASSTRPDKKKVKRSHDCSKSTTEWVSWCTERGYTDIVPADEAGKVFNVVTNCIHKRL